MVMALSALATKGQAMNGEGAPASTEVTASKADPLFNQPYVDVDEWRDKPVHHRYVHGGFKGTAARFSFYFPPKEQYQGRFFQYVTPVPSSENLAQENPTAEHPLAVGIAFSISSGAYFIETNGGSLPAIAGDQTIPGYRVNATAAEYSRVLAIQMYGGNRPYGYVFGGSGGGYKTISGFENTSTWDGAVPYVIGSPMAIPNVFTARLLAMRVLGDNFATVVDAVEPGGSGDMYKGLTVEQQDALREVTRLGFPPLGWFNYKTLGKGAFPVLFPIIKMLDPKYFKDFWTLPGYEGVNPAESLQQARIQYRATVVRLVGVGDPETQAAAGGVDTAWHQLKLATPVGIQFDSVPSADLDLASLRIMSGLSAGKELPIGKVAGNTIFIAVNPLSSNNTPLLSTLKPGDEVMIDNSDLLAAQYYHRHQVPSRDFAAWDQFCDADGKPIYPQRRMLLGPMVTGAGSVQSGKFKGKMIVVESLMDQDAFPWQADWYRNKVKETLRGKLDENFRLWYTEHAIHGDTEWQEGPTRTVPYIGVLQQALRDVSAWVEKGIAPPASTNYKVVDAQVVVPPTAEQRAGIQPVVHVLANGGTRAEVVVHQKVQFTAVVEIPHGTGAIVKANWDMDGDGKFAESVMLNQQNRKSERIRLKATHAFDQPGTYFVTLRAVSQRQGDAATPFADIINIGQARVVVR